MVAAVRPLARDGYANQERIAAAKHLMVQVQLFRGRRL